MRSRGPAPNDHRLFGPTYTEAFREGTADLSWLLSRGYGANAALQLVGNRYRLNARQQTALGRMAAADAEVAERKEREISVTAVRGQEVAIDGFNLLILLENLLSGAYVFHCRDGTYRDISSVHGSYKHVAATRGAIIRVGEELQQLGAAAVHWYLDRPVSNSGRLLTLLYEIATERGFSWQVTLVDDPDKVLAVSPAVVVSSDGWILERAERWFNLGAHLVGLIGGKVV